MNYIDHNFDWLEDKLGELEGKYILFDFPGQVELYTHEQSVYNILQKLQKLNYKVRMCDVCCCRCVDGDSDSLFVLLQLSVVHLVDAHHCTDSSKFISVVMLSLSSMVRLELPHINVLSKIDLMQQYGKLGRIPFSFLLLYRPGISSKPHFLFDMPFKRVNSLQSGFLHGCARLAVPLGPPRCAKR